MISKKLRIQERRERVLTHIRLGNGPKIEQLVESTDLSRNEVAQHLAILRKKGRIFQNKQNCYFIMEAFNSARVMRSFNEFMYGCESPIHVYGVGYINPHTREGKRFLDP